MKYHDEEQETLKEILELRTEFEVLYLKKEKQLLAKKEKLFLQSQDFKQWNCDHATVEQLEPFRMELLGDKEKAFKFMLSEETKQLEEMRQELSFYTNQCWQETRRVSADNAEIFREHFITQAQLQVTYIN